MSIVEERGRCWICDCPFPCSDHPCSENKRMGEHEADLEGAVEFLRYEDGHCYFRVECVNCGVAGEMKVIVADHGTDWEERT